MGKTRDKLEAMPINSSFAFDDVQKVIVMAEIKAINPNGWVIRRNMVRLTAGTWRVWRVE